MSYTTCLKCGSRCKEKELDINLECWHCQYHFERKMVALRKITDTSSSGNGKKMPYFETIDKKLRNKIMQDVVDLYKIEIKNKRTLIEYLNEKYNIKLTTNVFSRITSLEHLASYGLSWKFELQKLKRVK